MNETSSIIKTLRQNAYFEARKRLMAFKSREHKNWMEALDKAISLLKVNRDLLRVYIDLSHIYGLQLNVICNDDNFHSCLDYVIAVGQSVFNDKCPVWGDIRVHHESGEKHSSYSNDYMLELRKSE